jgi:3-oxoadipate enol-lactonase
MMNAMELIQNVLDRKSCQIQYWLAGGDQAPLVVLTHGAYVDHHEWDETVPLLVNAGFRVLTWDVRGHGLSRPAQFFLREALDDLLALLDLVGAEQAILIGHSMGGNLHQEFVFHHPERVKALVMLDCTWNMQKVTRTEEWMAKIGLPMLGWWPYNSLVDSMANITASKPKDREYLKNTFRKLTQKEFVHIMSETMLCLHYEPDYRVDKPMLLILGDKDTTGNIRKIMPVWAKHDGAELVIIPNAQHAANFDQPELFHKHLLDFLNHQSY